MKKQLFILVLAFSAFVAGHAQSVQTLWATTSQGGALSGGSIFRVDPNGAGFTQVYDFACATGCTPYGNMLQASDGMLYGTCENGGPSGSCVIYRLDPVSGQYTDVHDFYQADGYVPLSGLTELNGKLWGVTYDGGAHNIGVIYNYDLSTGVYTDAFDFLDATTGGVPYGEPIAVNGRIYGMNTSGGDSNFGVIYCYDPAMDSLTVLHNFDDVNNGSLARGRLLYSNSKFYGVTYGGGSNGFGTIFSYDESTSTFTTLHTFAGPEGKNPITSVTDGGNGKLYGTTTYGGANNFGVVFSLDIATNTYTVLHDFAGTDGSNPCSDLALSPNGKLFGTTHDGGSGAHGVIYTLDPSNGNFNMVFDLGQTNGSGSYGGFCVVNSPLAATSPAAPGNTLSVFPNPAQNSIRVDLNSTGGNARFRILNPVGQVVMEWTENSPAAEYSKQVDIEKLDHGMFFLQVVTEKGITTRAFVKE